MNCHGRGHCAAKTGKNPYKNDKPGREKKRRVNDIKDIDDIKDGAFQDPRSAPNGLKTARHTDNPEGQNIHSNEGKIQLIDANSPHGQDFKNNGIQEHEGYPAQIHGVLEGGIGPESQCGACVKKDKKGKSDAVYDPRPHGFKRFSFDHA